MSAETLKDIESETQEVSVIKEEMYEEKEIEEQIEDDGKIQLSISPHEQIPKDKINKKGFRIDEILFSVVNNPSKCYLNHIPVNVKTLPSSTTTQHTSSPVSSFYNARLSNIFECLEHREKQSCVSPTKDYAIKHHFHSTRCHPSSHNLDLVFGGELHSPSNEGDAKKPRTSFTPDQVQALEDSFQNKRYLNHTERLILATELNLTDCQIKTWFQNRRMKMKRQYKEAVEKGYLTPYHPYPFPRYSRLTPAHFALLPALNAHREFRNEGREKCNGNTTKQTSNANVTKTRCSCCVSPQPTTVSVLPCQQREVKEFRYKSLKKSYTGQSYSSDHFKTRHRTTSAEPHSQGGYLETNNQHLTRGGDVCKEYNPTRFCSKRILEDTGKLYNEKCLKF